MDKELKKNPSSYYYFWKTLFWILIIVGGAGYGLIGYAFFDYFFSTPPQKSGVMAISFLVGLPFSLSATIAYRMKARFKAFFISFIIVVLASALSILFFKEGAICILMLLGMSIISLIGGILVGATLATLKRKLTSSSFMSIFLPLPFLLGVVEQHYIAPDLIQEVTQTVYIHAEPTVIWQQLLNPTNIKPSELQDGLAYKIGVPYPVEARTIAPKVGSIRKSVWQRGVTFDEKITALDENRYIAWAYNFNDDSFPPGALDDHVKIGGAYFDLLSTSYMLHPSNGGTYLDITVKYRITTNFNWYSVPMAYLFISDTADALLNFYRNRSEAYQAKSL